MKPLSEVAPGLLVIQVQNQVVWDRLYFLGNARNAEFSRFSRSNIPKAHCGALAHMPTYTAHSKTLVLRGYLKVRMYHMKT
jgi:hypothetical protein